MPKVSVVIPAYNVQAYLPLTLEWTLRSTLRDFEVVVVDDGSTDGTGESAKRFGPKVRVIAQSNAGMSAARNNGISSGDSEFVALLDGDDIWHPEKLQRQVALLEVSKEYGFCFTEFVPWNGDLPITFPDEHVCGQLDPNLSGWIYHRMVLTNWVLPSSVMFRRSAWATTGDFLCEDHKTDDWEYFVRASRQFQFAKLRAVMVLYRQHPGSLSRRITTENVGEAMRERLLQQYGYLSPDGVSVDLAELTARRYRGKRDFADVHCSRGDLITGLRNFLTLIAEGPNRSQSVLCLARSLRRRMLGS